MLIIDIAAKSLKETVSNLTVVALLVLYPFLCSSRQVFKEIGNFSVVRMARHLLKYLYSTLGLKHVFFPAGEKITVQFPLQEYAPILLGDLNQNEFLWMMAGLTSWSHYCS